MRSTQLPLPEGYRARAPEMADAPVVAALRAADDMALTGRSNMTTEEVLSEWQGINLAQEAILVTAPDGSAAAYADVLNRSFVSVFLYGYVHPTYYHLGLGAWLVRWGEQWTRDRMAQAPETARIIQRQFIRAVNAPACRLLETLGYTPVRTTYVMRIVLDALPPEPVWPEGLRVRCLEPGQDDRAAYEAHEEASRDMWERTPGTFEEWQQFQARTDPALLFVAEDTRQGAIAGLCACQAVGSLGYVSSLRVRKSWRRQGLGLALLRHAFGAFYQRGIREISLSVDAASPTGAPRLYARAGMHVAESYTLYQKELRPAGTPPAAGSGMKEDM